MSEKRRKGTMTVHVGEGIYQLELAQIPPNSLDPDAPLKCPCCGIKLRVVTETCVWGEFEDKFTLFLACVPCLKGFLYNYQLSRIELASAEENHG